MKTFAKILIILSCICGFWLIFPLVIGIITLKKMKEAKCKEDIKTWGILCLLFCNLLGGILLLCISDEEWAKAE